MRPGYVGEYRWKFRYTAAMSGTVNIIFDRSGLLGGLSGFGSLTTIISYISCFTINVADNTIIPLRYTSYNEYSGYY